MRYVRVAKFLVGKGYGKSFENAAGILERDSKNHWNQGTRKGYRQYPNIQSDKTSTEPQKFANFANS